LSDLPKIVGFPLTTIIEPAGDIWLRDPDEPVMEKERKRFETSMILTRTKNRKWKARPTLPR